jgi:hypothetical protein
VVLAKKTPKNKKNKKPNSYEDQCNRIEDPDLNLHSYTHLIFDTGPKNT